MASNGYGFLICFDDSFLCARAARAFVSNSFKEAEALAIFSALKYIVAKGFSRIQVLFLCHRGGAVHHRNEELIFIYSHQ